ncbi:ankyrin repeat family protein [Salix suchowensis]|nr:ankyrin repeat family protein [Salix suchowensis]
MASEAPSWADQWGAGGFGSMEEDNYATKQDTSNEKKSDAKGGLNKAKTAAMSGAQKLKSGASSSFKWEMQAIRCPFEQLILVDMSMQLLNILAQTKNKNGKRFTTRSIAWKHIGVELQLYKRKIFQSLFIASRRIERTSFISYICTPSQDHVIH